MEIKRYSMTDKNLYRNVQKTVGTEIKYYHIEDDFLDFSFLEELNSVLNTYDSKLIDSNLFKNGINNENLDWFFITSSKDLVFKSYDDLIIQKCLEVNSAIFNYNLDSLIDTKYLVYTVGKYSTWHVDEPIGVKTNNVEALNAAKWRKLSVSIALNDDYDGGEFGILIPTDPRKCLHNIKLKKGAAIFYPSHMAHQISTVTNGCRKSLVYWFCGPRHAN